MNNEATLKQPGKGQIPYLTTASKTDFICSTSVSRHSILKVPCIKLDSKGLLIFKLLTAMF